MIKKRKTTKKIPKKKVGLSDPNHELFCQLFASSGSETFANGTHSYLRAYNITDPNRVTLNSAASAASRLLRNVKICDRISEILDLDVLNDIIVDSHLAYLVHQFDDNGAKLGAIKEYNQLKNRIKNKLELSGELKTALVEFIGDDETDGKNKS